MDPLGIRTPRGRLALYATGGIGAAALAVGLATSPGRAWAALMVGNYLAISIALGSLVFVALNHVFTAGWAVLFRRVPEALSAYLPVGALVLVATFLLGGSLLYPWMRPEVMAADPHLQHKQAFLNPTAFAVVTLVSFAVWIGYGAALRRHSRAQDSDGSVRHTIAAKRLSGGFLVLSGLTVIASSFMWLMSLEPKWTSTMYPGYVYSAMLATASAVIALLVIALNRRGALPGVTEGHIYELSRLICASITLWAYIWFSQYMLVYYTNIPEESIYFAVRRTGPFGLLFLVNVAINWLVPMLMLLTDKARRSPARVARAAAVVLVGRWLDAVLLISPAVTAPLQLSWHEALIPLVFAPVLLLTFSAAFGKASAVPERDPYLVESQGLAA